MPPDFLRPGAFYQTYQNVYYSQRKNVEKLGIISKAFPGIETPMIP
ncbi:MAG: hypothetical protein RMI91_15220 [Gemmatales bacterium]|nr:hypothetical protein [Gemmatales bacterium]MDW7995996.1 hypothetical protein [Gemmatales bacterium]